LIRAREGKDTFLEASRGVFLAVETCSKALFSFSVGHGKSPWFLRVPFHMVVRVDEPVPVLAFVDVGIFLECAF
jgi:hypothetical protein